MQFLVQGSDPDPYVIDADRLPSGDIVIHCSCPAGQHLTYCKHRFALLDGDITNFISADPADVEQLRAWLPGTRLATALEHLRTAQAAFDHAQAELKSAKRAVARVMNTP